MATLTSVNIRVDITFCGVFSNPITIYLPSGRVGRVTSIIVVSKCQLLVCLTLLPIRCVCNLDRKPLLNFNKMDVA